MEEAYPVEVYKEPQRSHHLERGFDENDVCKERMTKLHDTISGIPGIIISGMAHYNKGPIIFFFTSRDQEGLFFLSWCCDRRYFQYGDKWKIEVSVADTSGEGENLLPITYTLVRELEKGENLLDASKEIEELIKNINHNFNHQNFIEHYGIKRENFSFRFVGEFINVKLKNKKNDTKNQELI